MCTLRRCCRCHNSVLKHRFGQHRASLPESKSPLELNRLLHTKSELGRSWPVALANLQPNSEQSRRQFEARSLESVDLKTSHWSDQWEKHCHLCQLEPQQQER